MDKVLRRFVKGDEVIEYAIDICMCIHKKITDSKGGDDYVVCLKEDELPTFIPGYIRTV